MNVLDDEQKPRPTHDKHASFLSLHALPSVVVGAAVVTAGTAAIVAVGAASDAPHKPHVAGHNALNRSWLPSGLSTAQNDASAVLLHFKFESKNERELPSIASCASSSIHAAFVGWMVVVVVVVVVCKSERCFKFVAFTPTPPI